VNRSAIPSIIASKYIAHALHRDAREWPVSNCYVDLWIEVLHALGLDPHAMLSHAIGVDFEADQWTFYKPPLEDLRRLYGIDVQELQIYGELLGHVCRQLAERRIVLVEVDAFHLPDTRGSSYQQAHVKTTIAIERVDLMRRRLGYFHNGGYWLLEGDDFVALLERSGPLPPYAELAKLERAERLGDQEIKQRAGQLLVRDIARRPRENPLTAYIERFAEHAELLHHGDLDRFHAYAFATLRQCGSAFELGARHLRWLDPVALASAAAEFEILATAAKAAVLRLARAVQRQRPLDLHTLSEVVPHWDVAFDKLDAWASSAAREPD
jgi:hypothetical protein